MRVTRPAPRLVVVLLTAAVGLMMSNPVWSFETTTITVDDGLAALQKALDTIEPGEEILLINAGDQRPYRVPSPGIIIKNSGTADRPIRLRSDGTAPAILTAAADWTDQRAGGTKSWQIQAGTGHWITTVDEEPVAFWLTSQAEWEQVGFPAMAARAKYVDGDVVPGTWGFLPGTKQVWYKPTSQEDISNSHIEIVSDTSGVSVYGASDVIIQDLKIALTGGNGITITGDSQRVSITNLVINGAWKNGIVIKGGADHLISNCEIHDIGNNGIYISGDKGNEASRVSVKGCQISGIKRNDCIGVHSGDDGTQAGRGHVIADNVTEDCAEQGIDVTSGGDVLLSNNRTTGSGDSGVVIGHGVDNVVVEGHRSIDDGRFGGILVKTFVSNIEIRDSCFIDTPKQQLMVQDVDDLRVSNSIFASGPGTEGLVFRVVGDSKNVVFDQNSFASVGSEQSAKLVKYAGEAGSSGRVTYTNNHWYTSSTCDADTPCRQIPITNPGDTLVTGVSVPLSSRDLSIVAKCFDRSLPEPKLRLRR